MSGGCDKTAWRAADGCGWSWSRGRWLDGCVTGRQRTQTDAHLMHLDISSGRCDVSKTTGAPRCSTWQSVNWEMIDPWIRIRRNSEVRGAKGGSARFSRKEPIWRVRARGSSSLGHVRGGGLKRGRFFFWDQSNRWVRCLEVSPTPYLGRRRLHPAGCRPRWCGSP